MLPPNLAARLETFSMDIDTPDLFVMEDGFTGSVEDEFGPSFFIMLRNFDLNSSVLKLEHVDILKTRVVPYTQRTAGFAEIYAMTDRSGAKQLNYQVSGQRLQTVQQAMIALGAAPGKARHSFAKAIGEDFFESRHNNEAGDTFFNDGIKNAGLRVVVIGLSPAPIGVPTRRFRNRNAADTLAFCRIHVQTAG